MAAAGTLAREIGEIPDLVAARLAAMADIAHVAHALRRFAPRFAVTIARGSSDAAAEAVARALGGRLGLITASLPPSLVTLDRAPLRWDGALVLAISQSGRSPDLIEATRAARDGGALVVGIVNDPGAPLAECCTHVLAAGAHPEESVAATKSVVLSWLAGMLLAELAADPAFDPAGWAGLVPALRRAVATAWPDAAVLLDRPHALVLGRGAHLAAAKEIALKLKELAGLPAEAISSAEVLHGPRAAVTERTAVLALGADAGMAAALAALRGAGATVVTVAPGAPLVQLASLYPLALELARARGRDPDAPRHLTKVTLTR
jgi:glucosamine--fructose-6-phosphate aminotransferase (isomerizing)